MKEDVDVIVSAGETFLRFHGTTNKVLTPKGVKRVEVALSVNEINCYLVMITLDIFANITVFPFIICTVVFGTILMNEYKYMTNRDSESPQHV